MNSPLDNAAVTRFDDAADRYFSKWRGHKVADRVFYTASEAANHSLLWHGLTWTLGIWTKAGRKRAVRTSIALGVESALVNGPIKKLFSRPRPESEVERPHKLRQPLTSSFPSGHATSGFVAAALIGHGRRSRPLIYALAAIVATSRSFVKIHHASDVLGGVVLGIFGGKFATRVIFGSSRKLS